MRYDCPWGHPLIHLEVVDSTQEEARRLYKRGMLGDGTVIWAEEQISGRGRHGRRWVSQRGKGLWFTVAFKPRLPSARLQLLCISASLGILDVLRGLGLRASIKWPNDILVSGRKICGILVEGLFKGEVLDFCLLGVGINLKSVSDIIPCATSVEEELGYPIDSEDLLRSVLHSVHHRVRELEENPEAVLSEYKSNCMVLGRKISFKRGEDYVWGDAIDINPDGNLIIMLDEKICVLNSEIIEEVR